MQDRNIRLDLEGILSSCMMSNVVIVRSFIFRHTNSPPEKSKIGNTTGVDDGFPRTTGGEISKIPEAKSSRDSLNYSVND